MRRLFLMATTDFVLSVTKRKIYTYTSCITVCDIIFLPFSLHQSSIESMMMRFLVMGILALMPASTLAQDLGVPLSWRVRDRFFPPWFECFMGLMVLDRNLTIVALWARGYLSRKVVSTQFYRSWIVVLENSMVSEPSSSSRSVFVDFLCVYRSWVLAEWECVDGYGESRSLCRNDGE